MLTHIDEDKARRTKWFFSLVCWLCALTLLAITNVHSQEQPSDKSEQQIIRVPKYEFGDELFSYYHGLLVMALELTEEKYGKAVVEIEDIPTLQKRQIMGLKSAETHVIWNVSSGEHEKDFIAVPFPLSADLYSYRILAVNSDDKRFNKPLSKQQLQNMTAVQGREWRDFDILINNGFTVSEAEYHMTYRLLETNFVDYFPRSVIEVCEELNRHPHATIYPHIALYYPNLVRFYVNKGQTELANRLQEGLEVAYADGTILHRLIAQPFFRDFSVLIYNRQVLELESEIDPQTEDVLRHPLIDDVMDMVKALPEEWHELADSGRCEWRNSDIQPPAEINKKPKKLAR